LTKLADPRRALLGWLLSLGIIAVVIGGGWNLGLGTVAKRLQRQLVATGYLRQAEANARSVPVRRDKALAALNRAVTLAPDDPTVGRVAADLYVELRAYTEAVQWLTRRAQQRLAAPVAGVPDVPEWLARTSLAQSLVMTGRVSEGQSLLVSVERETYEARGKNQLPDPVFALLLNNLAYVNGLAKTNLSDALQMATVAVQLQPTQSAFLDSLGWVEYQLGDYRNAAFHLEQSLRLMMPHESAEMYYHLGAAYARLGKKADARWALNRCLELDPSFYQAVDELRRLSQDLPLPAVV
jgi:predicted Zn-dependent protease